MGKVTMEGVQKLLHLDTKYENFPTWEETLEFEVNGVEVKAIATHKWRGDSVRIVEPIEVEGSDYLQGFHPLLMALGACVMGRRRSLASRGLTERDDCVRMARNTYILQATYLSIKPDVDRDQEEFESFFRDELDSLLNIANQAIERMQIGRRALRQQLHANQLTPKQYQALLTSLQQEAELCESEHNSLEHDVEYELRKIKLSLINRSLIAEIEYPQSFPL